MYSSQQAKRGQSEILAYVLLIVLAIGMSAAVYAFLKFYVPKDQAKCPEGTSLIVEDVSCNQATGSFAISLRNKGLFNIDGAYIKVGDVGRTYKTIINCPNENSIETCQLYFNIGSPSYILQALKPGENWTRTFAYNLGTGEKDIEIQPIVVVSNKSRVVCENNIVTRSVTCT